MNINNSTDFGTVKILMLKGEKGDQGDAGVSGDYSGLTNKPRINNVTLNGAMTSDSVGLVSQTAFNKINSYPILHANQYAYKLTLSSDETAIQASQAYDSGVSIANGSSQWIGMIVPYAVPTILDHKFKNPVSGVTVSEYKFIEYMSSVYLCCKISNSSGSAVTLKTNGFNCFALFVLNN